MFKYNLKKDDIIYCRAWDGKTFEEATCYGDSATYKIQHSIVDFNIFASWDTNECSCAITLEPKAEVVMLRARAYSLRQYRVPQGFHPVELMQDFNMLWNMLFVGGISDNRGDHNPESHKCG